MADIDLANINETIDDGGLAIALTVASEKARNKVPQAVRKASLFVMAGVKSDMPVDTGRARASWGVWKPGDMANQAEAYKRGAGPDDAIWEVEDDGLTITQGSNVEYIEALNNGHSQQMGAGFIDNWAQTGAYELVKDIEDILNEVF